MGCFSSKPTAEPAPKKKKEGDAFKRPQWKSDGSWDEAELQVVSTLRSLSGLLPFSQMDMVKIV